MVSSSLPGTSHICEVTARDLCTGCGTCAGICPTDAIAMDFAINSAYRPTVDAARCTSCGLCRRACPQTDPDTGAVRPDCGAEKENGAWQPLGTIEAAFAGHATDAVIHARSASGGMVTAFLFHLLRAGEIDAALVSGPTDAETLRPRSLLVRSPEELLATMGSWYGPIPVNEQLRAITRHEGRYAVVGLPCHIRGIRRAMAISPILRERIAWCLGLFCNHGMTGVAPYWWVDRLGGRAGDGTRLSYRDGDWPGRVTTTTRDGHQLGSLAFPAAWSVCACYYMCPRPCMLCGDYAAIEADIAFADAWPLSFAKPPQGASFVLARDTRAATALSTMQPQGEAVLLRVDPNEFVRSQSGAILWKSRGLSARLRLVGVRGRAMAKIQAIVGPPTPLDYVCGLWALTNMHLSRSHIMRALLRRVPLKVFAVQSALMGRMTRWRDPLRRVLVESIGHAEKGRRPA